MSCQSSNAVVVRPSSNVRQTYCADGSLNLYDHIARLLKEPLFKSFVNRYCATWSDTKATLMLLNLFVFVSDEFNRETGKEMPTEQCADIVRDMMSDVDCRGLIVRGMSDFMNRDRRPFLEAFRRKHGNLKTLDWQVKPSLSATATSTRNNCVEHDSS